MPNVHRFESSGEAYDDTQTDDNIKDGDILIVESEGVVGFLMEAWPVAVSDTTGAFHQLNEDADITALTRASGDGTRDYSESFNLANMEWERLKNVTQAITTVTIIKADLSTIAVYVSMGRDQDTCDACEADPSAGELLLQYTQSDGVVERCHPRCSASFYDEDDTSHQTGVEKTLIANIVAAFA